MAQHHHTAEFLGELPSGGRVESMLSSISLRQAEMARSRAAGSVAASRATETARRAVVEGLATRRAAEMDLGAFTKGLLIWISSPVTVPLRAGWDLLAWVCSATLAVLTWMPWILLAIALLALLAYSTFYIAQGLAFQPAFQTVQRRVWYEDFDPEYELPLGVLGWVLGKIFTVLLWPVRVVWIVLRVVWAMVDGTAKCGIFYTGLGRGLQSLRETAEGLWMEVRYNALTDRLRRGRWLVSAWLSRNLVRFSLLFLAISLAWNHLSLSSSTPLRQTPHPLHPW